MQAVFGQVDRLRIVAVAHFHRQLAVKGQVFIFQQGPDLFRPDLRFVLRQFDPLAGQRHDPGNRRLAIFFRQQRHRRVLMPDRDGLVAPDQVGLVDKAAAFQRMGVLPGLRGHIDTQQPEGTLLGPRQMGPGQFARSPALG